MPVMLPQAFRPCCPSVLALLLLEVGKQTPGPSAVPRVKGAEIIHATDPRLLIWKEYLIDMGVGLLILPASCFPSSSTGSSSGSLPHLYTANSMTIKTFGVCTCTPHLGGSHYTTPRLAHGHSFPFVGRGLSVPLSAACGCFGATFTPAQSDFVLSLCWDEPTSLPSFLSEFLLSFSYHLL